MTELTWTQDTARLDSLELWEHNPKRMSKTRAERLLQSWRDMNQYQTLAVGPAGECYDGHQRIQALRAAGYDGEYEVAVMRSSRALTDEERRRLIIESTVGTVGALNWDEIAAWPSAEVQGYGLDAEALAEWNDAGANLALMLEAGGIGGQDESYSRKIEPPIYTPSQDKPGISALFNAEKTNELIARIESAEGITEQEREFLKLAAYRHTVLNFQNIADYYAHSGEKMQGLMEDSALVIIDFGDAIKQGFVELSLEIANMVKDEYGDE